MNIQVKILEVTGLEIAARYVGLPVGKIRSRSEVLDPSRWMGWYMNQESFLRLSKLIAKGDEHAKIMRQVVVHMEITAPRYWWIQFSTYHAGVEMYSGSTMHTLLVRKPSIDDFAEQVTSHTYRAFKEVWARGDITETKANLPEGFLQTRLVMISYQALRRMWLQRQNHKLPEWHSFLEALVNLPYSSELVFVKGDPK